MTTTRIVQYSALGGPEVLEILEAPLPSPAPGEVRVRVKAVGLNPIDYKMRRGGGPRAQELPSRVGRELAGVVDAVGTDVTRLAVGDDVFGPVPVGTLADFCLVAEDLLALKPADVSWPVAGGLGLAGQTAWDSLASQSLQAGDTIVVTAAAGGVGGTLCQLAVSRGMRVIGTASPANHEWLTSRGVEPIAYGPELVDEVRGLTNGGTSLTAAFDHAGDDSVRQLLELGIPADRINTVAAYSPDLGVCRVGRGPTNIPALEALAAMAAAGTVDVPVEATFALGDVQAAFERLETRHLRGKIIVLPGDRGSL